MLNNHKSRSLFVLILVVLLASVIGNQTVHSQTPPPGVRVDVSASPTTVDQGQPVDVTLTLVGNGQVCAAEEVYRPLRVALVVDRSGSMEEGLGDTQTMSKMDAAVSAVGTFLTLLDIQKDEASLISFAEDSRLDAPLSSPAEALALLPQGDAGLNSGGTNIEAGLREAYESLRGIESEELSLVIVLLTDGHESSGSAASLAEDVKASNIRIVTIGLGPEVSETLLRSMASQSSDYYYAPRVEDLEGIYESIVKMVKEYDPATDISVLYEFDASNFSLVPESITPQPSQVTSNRIEWQFSRLDVNQQQMHLTLIANSPGNYNAVKSIDLSYKRCGSEDVSETPIAQFPIDVGGEITPTLCEGEPVAGSVSSFMCDRIPWGWIIGLLSLVLLLLWFYARNQNIIRSWLRCGISPLLCFWSKLLWTIFLSVVLGVLAHHLAGYACTPRSGLMFWRIYPDLSSAIYLQPEDESRNAIPITPRTEQESCIGCHMASDNAQSFAAIANGTNGQLVRWGYDGEQRYLPDIQGSYPAYSPDGTRIAYAANNEDIYILDIASGLTQPLEGASQSGVIESMPAWNADGSQIAFVRASGANQSSTITTPCDILTVPATGGIPILVTGASSYGFNYHPAYSPDGKWLAFVHHDNGTTTYGDPKSEIYLVPADGGAPRRLAVNDGPGGQKIEMGNTWPVWSADSSTLYFSSRRCNDQNDIYSTTILPDGNSTPANRLHTVSDALSHEYGAQEVHLSAPSLAALLGKILPWIIPLLVWLLLNAILCRHKNVKEVDTLRVDILPAEPAEGKLISKQRFKVIAELIGLEMQERRAKPQRVDAVLLIDCSGSMALPVSVLENRLGRVRKGAKRFVRCFMTPGERLGIVAFGSSASEIQPLTVNENDLIKAVNKLKPDQGGTEISKGIRSSMEVLCHDERKRTPRVIVLFTDGEPTESEQDTLSAAQEAHNNGIRIIAVGTANANKNLLRQIVQDASDFIYVQDINGLENAFLNISRKLLKPVAATNVSYKHRFDAQKFEVVKGSIKPECENFDPELGVITWCVDELDERPVEFEYQVRPLIEGSHEIVLPGSVEYNHGGSGSRRVLGVLGGAMVKVNRARQIKQRQLTTPATLRRPNPVWHPDRALLIGVGTSGRWILTYLLDNFINSGYGELPEGIQFLAVDTIEDRKKIQIAETTSVALSGIRLSSDDLFVLDENLEPSIRELARSPQQLSEYRGWFNANDHLQWGAQLDLTSGTFSRRTLPRYSLLRILKYPAKVNSHWMKKRAKENQSMDLKAWIRQRCEKLMPQDQEQEQPQARVIVVGSLAGGMGGLISDVAILARKVAQEVVGNQGTVKIEGYLVDGALAGAFQELSESAQAEKRANSFAALREIERFQMNPGYPMPIDWEVNETVDHPLFDDLVLFSQEPNPQYAHKNYNNIGNMRLGDDMLAHYIYPSMADILTLRLDKAMDASGIHDYFNSIRANTTNEMNRQHQFMVNGAGVYTIRVAVASLLRSLHMRWIYELMRIFLTGEPERNINFSHELEERTLEWTWKGHKEEDISPEDLVTAFLSGELDEEASIASIALADYLRFGQSELVHSQAFDDYIKLAEDAQMRAQMRRLALLQRTILTGELHGSRAERVAYTLRFLESSINQLGQLLDTLNKAGEERLERYARLCIRAAQTQQANLLRLRDLISCNQPGKEPGLWERVTLMAIRLQNLEKELDAIVNRQYIWGSYSKASDGSDTFVTFRDEWWQKFLQGQISSYMDALDWVIITEDNLVDLGIKAKEASGNGQRSVFLGKDGWSDFVNFLLKIASSLTVEAYATVNLAQLLTQASRLPNADAVGRFSMPICGDVQGAAALAPDRLLRISPTDLDAVLGWETQFGQSVASAATRESLVHMPKDSLPGSNPTMAAFLHLRNSIAVANLHSYDITRRDYDRFDEYDENQGHFNGARPQPRACYRAEGEARWLEVQYNQDRRSSIYNYRQFGPIHPYIVTGLMYPARAEIFMMAFAEGCIEQTSDQRIIFQMPEYKTIELLREPHGYIDPYVEAYLNWIYRIFNQPENYPILKNLSQRYAWQNIGMFRENIGKWLQGPQSPLDQGIADRKSLGASIAAIVSSYNASHQLRWNIDQEEN